MLWPGTSCFPEVLDPKSIYRAVIDPHEMDVRAFGDTEVALLWVGLRSFFIFFIPFNMSLS